MYPLVIYPLAPSVCPRLLRLKISLAATKQSIWRGTYLVLTDVKVEGSDLPVSRSTMSGPTLVIIQKGTMATSPMSSTNGMHALSTCLVVEDRREVGGHDDERLWDREVPVKVGELTDPMAGVISEDQIPIKIPVGTSIRNLERSGPSITRRPITIHSLSSNRILAITKIMDYLRPGLSVISIFIFSLMICNRVLGSNMYKHGPCTRSL